jgi:hypothetical protein
VRTIRKVTTSAAAAAALGLVAAACSGGSSGSSTATGSSANGSGSCKSSSQVSSLSALPGYQVCLFAGATTSMNHPDDVRYVNGNVWIAWQNSSAKDGSTTNPSTIAEYTSGGKLLKTWSVIGHADGMRMDPMTHQMWVTTDEDAKPRLYTINPSSSTPTQYTVPTTSWGGGFDDIEFVNGSAYTSASNPTLNSAGKNPNPAIVKVTLSGTKAVLSQALPGEVKATSLNPPVAATTLTLTDPDSMSTDPQGDLVFMSQGDGSLLFIHGIGTSSQTVKYVTVGTQIDDTIWPTSSKGCLLVADNSSGVFSVCSNIWVPGAPVSSSPNDAGVISFVGTLNPMSTLASGQLTPFLVGMGNPHGMAFIPK